MYLVVVGNVFFGTVANVVEGERVEMTKHIGGLAMSSLYCSSSNQNSSHCRGVSRLPGFFLCAPISILLRQSDVSFHSLSLFYFSHSDFNPLFEEISNRVGTKAPSRFTCRQSYSDPDDNQLD